MICLLLACSFGEHFAVIWGESFGAMLHGGQCVLGDNLNYHCMGWTFEHVKDLLNSLGVQVSGPFFCFDCLIPLDSNICLLC
jgi:hypothetical protein